ncbi:heavy metal-associated isoprenylated plant protein 28 [Syzygium oleosum]|uniref:heavy metal-associated isoprenylated plant protein 28 n=1 Tax=Syzygium oleosum TaxID=219896 RepID=UPI0011D1B7CD|nr:heavy metal-associated isoprenylated plant protein 28 [Syzygium oleosum]
MTDMQIVPAYKTNVEAQYVEMMVPLYSYGCEKKIKKALAHTKGIYSVNVDYNQQKVTIWGICNKYDVLETMRTKRKEARFWNPEDNSADDLESRKGTDDVKHLIKSRSLSWRAWKRVFTRSNSF